MKHLHYKKWPLWVLISLTLSCAKQSTPPGTATLTLINAVPNSSPSLVPNFSGAGSITWYYNALKLTYGTWNSNYTTGDYSGEQKLAVYHYPDTTAHSTPLMNMTLNLPVGTMHTLFLTGTMTAPDTLFTNDNPPYHPASDSSMGIRFVNLSPGSSPVSVNITGHANGSELTSLPYKSITGFKNYPAASTVSSYTFEFRDAASGTLISSLTVTGVNNAANNTRRYRNFTIALLGLPGDATTLKTLLISAYY